MSDSKKPESVLVMPVSGKYCEIISGTQSYRIWKVHPNTPETYGTRIPYDVAVDFLGKSPPVITLVPETKGGKFVSQLLEEDQKAIQEALERGFSGGKNYNASSATPLGDGKDSEALSKAVGLLQKEVKKSTALEAQLQDLTTRLAELEKNAKK